jgi:hypothetical protein
MVCAGLVVCKHLSGGSCSHACNSLEVLLPKMLDKWDTLENRGISPKDVAVNDTRRFWWTGIVCQQPVSFPATIRMRLDHCNKKASRGFAGCYNIYRRQQAMLGIRECHGDWW